MKCPFAHILILAKGCSAQKNDPYLLNMSLHVEELYASTSKNTKLSSLNFNSYHCLSPSILIKIVESSSATIFSRTCSPPTPHFNVKIEILAQYCRMSQSIGNKSFNTKTHFHRIRKGIRLQNA